MRKKVPAEISLPLFLEGSDNFLGLESTLVELPLFEFQIEAEYTGWELGAIFDKYPLLPGVVLLEKSNYVGMISRRRFLDFLIRPFGQELFFKEALSVLYSYARTEVLTLSENTQILTAMQLAMRRNSEHLSEPIVVKTSTNNYRLLDIQQLHRVSWQIRGIETQVRYERSQAQIIQNDKMANLGRLVDGVAHEILDPVNFIWGNLTHLANYSQDLLKLAAIYKEEFQNDSDDIIEFKQEIDFDFLEEDLAKTLQSIKGGAERLKKLVTGLQNFCHIDEIYPRPADLHACINSLILLINSRLNGEIEIVSHYGNLPPVSCFIGQLNQVFLNILSLAVNTLLNEGVRQKFNSDIINNDVMKPVVKPRITITTEIVSKKKALCISHVDHHSEYFDKVVESRWVAIRISDNGPGMTSEEKQRIIDSFSVEKRADKETSLAISYQIVTARHGGIFNFNSLLDVGTEFEILLPLV